MKSVKVTKESEKFQEIERLYRAAFPREERVPMDTLLEADGPYDFIACYDGAILCGFYSALTFGDITARPISPISAQGILSPPFSFYLIT